MCPGQLLCLPVPLILILIAGAQTGARPPEAPGLVSPHLLGPSSTGRGIHALPAPGGASLSSQGPAVGAGCLCESPGMRSVEGPERLASLSE